MSLASHFLSRRRRRALLQGEGDGRLKLNAKDRFIKSLPAPTRVPRNAAPHPPSPYPPALTAERVKQKFSDLIPEIYLNKVLRQKITSRKNMITDYFKTKYGRVANEVKAILCTPAPRSQQGMISMKVPKSRTVVKAKESEDSDSDGSENGNSVEDDDDDDDDDDDGDDSNDYDDDEKNTNKKVVENKDDDAHSEFPTINQNQLQQITDQI